VFHSTDIARVLLADSLPSRRSVGALVPPSTSTTRPGEDAAVVPATAAKSPKGRKASSPSTIWMVAAPTAFGESAIASARRS
jgi:hypothetical protein